MSQNLIKKRTKNCTVPGCNKPGNIVGGHVHNGTEIIFAMICSNHMNHKAVKCSAYKGGCRGQFRPEMGLVDADGRPASVLPKFG
jgi:hypothetical protein